MATITPPVSVRDATPEEARVIVDHEVAWLAYRAACRTGTATQLRAAEDRWREALAAVHAAFPMRVGWYRLGGRRFGFHDFKGAGLEWGSKPDK